jgi:predicted ester cyclase
MKNPIFIFAFLGLFTVGCNGQKAKSNREANNAKEPLETVQAHLREVEKGNWEAANAFLSDSYKMKMKGMPFFVSIKKEDALLMHKARKTAFPDFKFNEKIEWAKDNQIKIGVYLTGTHTGLLDYPSNVGVPKTPATGKKIDLPVEYFIYTVENDKIVHTYGEIPEGNGPVALKKQLDISKK